MKKLNIFLIVGLMILVAIFCLWYYFKKDDKDDEFDKYIRAKNWVGHASSEVIEYADNNNIKINVSYEYSFDVEKGIVISQDIKEGEKIVNKVNIVVSNGVVPIEVYEDNNVNELGSVPIMMYHGIVDITNNDTEYIGGNVDRDGYNRTVEAFREDLEFYYREGYRMIRLDDYVDGIIGVEMGFSPIILTFDDGNENNFRVLGEENGELIIDPNCAVGVLEEFKKKYPDYGVTATFFVNASLFMQDKYNDKILNWLVNNGYDIGNHTMTHCDFRNIKSEKINEEVGGLYQTLESIIPGTYVSIVALPFGSPYSRNHSNYEFILRGSYLNVDYKTKAALRVGWEAEVSCFDKEFDATYLKRIRAYDNNGKDYDIEMNFRLLKDKRYISDGDVSTIVVHEKDSDFVNNKFDGLRIVTYSNNED